MPLGEAAQPPERLPLAGRKLGCVGPIGVGIWQAGHRGRRRQLLGRGKEVGGSGQGQCLPGSAERCEYCVGAAVRLGNAIIGPRSDPLRQGERHAFSDARIALAGVGPGIGFGEYARGTCFGRQPREFLRRVALPQDEPAAAAAQVRIERLQSAHQESHPLWSRIGRREQHRVKHEDRNDRPALC